MENVFKSLIILFLLAAPGEGQKFSFGSCPAQTTATITLATEFAGVKYREYARTYSLRSHNWTCLTYSFVVVTTDLQYTVQVRGVDKLTGGALTYDGSMTVAGKASAAATASTTTTTFSFSLSDKFLGGTSTFYIPYFSTGAYLILYACDNIPFGKLETAILLVINSATATDIQTAYNALGSLGIPRHAYRRTGQGCA